MKTSARRSPFALSLFFSIALFAGLVLAGTVKPQRPRKATSAKAPAKTQRARAKRAAKLKPPAATSAQPDPLPTPVTSVRPPQLSAAPAAYDSPREAAEFFRLKRLPDGATELPIEKYFEAQAQMREMPQYSTAANQHLPARAAMNKQQLEALPAWTQLGPNNIGGRTRALLIHPTNPSVMYAAGVSGGVWKTINGGALWTPLPRLDGQPRRQRAGDGPKKSQRHLRRHGRRLFQH